MAGARTSRSTWTHRTGEKCSPPGRRSRSPRWAGYIVTTSGALRSGPRLRVHPGYAAACPVGDSLRHRRPDRCRITRPRRLTHQPGPTAPSFEDGSPAARRPPRPRDGFLGRTGEEGARSRPANGRGLVRTPVPAPPRRPAHLAPHLGRYSNDSLFSTPSRALWRRVSRGFQVPSGGHPPPGLRLQATRLTG